MRRSLLVSSLLVLACGREVPSFSGEPFRRDPPRVGALHGRIVTTNNGDDSLSVADPTGPRPPERLTVGFSPVELEGPHHLSVDRQGRFVYVNLSMAVAGSGSGPHGMHGSGELPGYVLKIDAATARVVDSVQVDANPGDNTLSADGKTLYVTHFDAIKWAKAARAGKIREGDSRLIVVDTDTMAVKTRLPLCPAAHGTRLSADEKTLYATCGPDEIAVVDLASTPPAARRVPFPGAMEGETCQLCPYALAVAPDGLVWVSNLGQSGGSSGRGSVMIFDPTLAGGSFDAGRTITFRGSPVFAAFAATGDGYQAYVPEQGLNVNAVRVFAPRGPGKPPEEIEALILSAADCLLAHMILLDEGRRAHLVCEGDHRGPGSFVWLERAPLKVAGALPIGVFPDGMAFVPMPR